MNTKPISTGYSRLDEMLLGGLAAPEMTLIAGESGSGIETLILALIATAMSDGRVVLFVSMEPSSELGLLASVAIEEGCNGSIFLRAHSAGHADIAASVERLVAKHGVSLVVFNSLHSLEETQDGARRLALLREACVYSRVASVMVRLGRLPEPRFAHRPSENVLRVKRVVLEDSDGDFLGSNVECSVDKAMRGMTGTVTLYGARGDKRSVLEVMQ